MKKYEIMYILNSNLDETNRKSVIESLNKILTDNGAKISDVNEWGNRELAYEIKKNKEAYYVQFNFDSKQEAITELERVYRITDDVLKFITIRK